MRHYGKKTTPAREDMQYIHSTCDICGSMLKGSFRAYMEHDQGFEYELDQVEMCKQCFEEVLMPWLVEHGARPTKSKHYYDGFDS